MNPFAAVGYRYRLGHPMGRSRRVLGTLWALTLRRTHLKTSHGDECRLRTPAAAISAHLVKAALANLSDPTALYRSELRLLPCISQNGPIAADLRALLVDVICDLAASSAPRDAEAGHLLFDYYVKKVGSHEVIMERLHLSRPTFYRRLNRGLAVIANQLNELGEFTDRFGLENPIRSWA